MHRDVLIGTRICYRTANHCWAEDQNSPHSVEINITIRRADRPASICCLGVEQIVYKVSIPVSSPVRKRKVYDWRWFCLQASLVNTVHRIERSRSIRFNAPARISVINIPCVVQVGSSADDSWVGGVRTYIVQHNQSCTGHGNLGAP
ncbi:MAG: hypothetical protein C5S49_03500 [Candidatus Methanogaster sp.]|nr:MAG: hypothetical protein C5S49_03500 [ANME-2 cluster archaeon]